MEETFEEDYDEFQQVPAKKKPKKKKGKKIIRNVLSLNGSLDFWESEFDNGLANKILDKSLTTKHTHHFVFLGGVGVRHIYIYKAILAFDYADVPLIDKIFLELFELVFLVLEGLQDKEVALFVHELIDCALELDGERVTKLNFGSFIN